VDVRARVHRYRTEVHRLTLPLPAVPYPTFLREDCGRQFNLTRRDVFPFDQLPSEDIATSLMCCSLTILGERAQTTTRRTPRASPVRVVAGGSDVDRKLLMAETLTA
jgi:hypothetical protein